jgi:beta-lactam-binding protein with PASTA domain
VSNGKGEPITVPRLVGMTESRAAEELVQRGLAVETDHAVVQDKSRDGIVIAQSPIGNGHKTVDPGTVVTITVGTFEGGDDGGGGPGNGNGSGNGNGGGGG